MLNYDRDLPGQYVLISKDYWYFGEDAISIPQQFLSLANIARGYRKFDNEEFIQSFYNWLLSLPQFGYIGKPYLFNGDFKRYSGKWLYLWNDISVIQMTGKRVNISFNLFANMSKSYIIETSQQRDIADIVLSV